MSDNSIDDSMNERPVEVSWFSALCDDDYQFLGIEDPALKASWPHCRDIALTAEQNGFDNILLPSGYQLGMDLIGFAGGIAPLLEKMRLLGSGALRRNVGAAIGAPIGNARPNAWRAADH